MPKIMSVFNHGNYYVISLRLKNTSVTDQRLMDAIFSNQIWRNMKFYIDDMIVKTLEEGSHYRCLKYILELVRRYNMHLNPANCSFRVQAGNIFGFMLTKRGIETNLDKF